MTTEMTYRRTSINGASPIGLIIALFDTLVGDFQRAAAAIHKNDIETRCREMNHALLVIGHLESWVDPKAGGESARALSRFYAYLRAKMMEASLTKAPRLLESQIDMILHVRSSWQQLDCLPPASDITLEVSPQAGKIRNATSNDTEPERIRFSQSA